MHFQPRFSLKPKVSLNESCGWFCVYSVQARGVSESFSVNFWLPPNGQKSLIQL